MKEINIARTIINKRKEKGITQEELANHIGVSSASVSKWETAQSYPDIVLLPQLASYFNISIDELMNYEPQMAKRDIAKLYSKLYEDLSNKPFDDVIEQCREAIKKYFSCFPLLLQMGGFLLSAGATIGDSEKTYALIAEAKELFVRVKKESDDAELIRTALYMEACCAVALTLPDEAIELLEKAVVPALPNEVLLASAYRMTERNAEAETTLQIGIYQNIVSALGLLSTYAMFETENQNKLDEIVSRTLSLVDSFNIKELQPSAIISFYVVAAQSYIMNQDTEKSLDLLEQYAELAGSDISFRVNGDGFFSSIQSRLNENGKENQLISHEAVKQSLVYAVTESPALSVLSDNPRFQRVVKKLEATCQKE